MRVVATAAELRGVLKRALQLQENERLHALQLAGAETERRLQAFFAERDAAQEVGTGLLLIGQDLM